MIIEEDVYLEHFGVKGMQWGVRRNKAALQRDRQASREVKAQKFDAKAKMLQTKISEIDAKLPNSNFYRKRALQEQRNELSKQKETAIKDAEAKRQGKMSSKQKKVAIGVGIAATVLAAYGANSFVQSGEMNRSIMRGKAFINKEQGSVWKKNMDLADFNMDADAIMANVVKPINPGYGGIGTKMNCRRATFAYEMRRRGNDVAATRTTSGLGQTGGGIYNAITPGVKERAPSSKVGLLRKMQSETRRQKKGKIESTPIKNYLLMFKSLGEEKIEATPTAMPTKIFQTISKQPNGARGELGVRWKAGGGHSLAYEIVKGKPVIFDAQSGKKYESNLQFIRDFGETVSAAGITRLDNIPLNDDFLMRWLKNAS